MRQLIFSPLASIGSQNFLYDAANYLHARRDRMNLKGVSTQNILG